MCPARHRSRWQCARSFFFKSTKSRLSRRPVANVRRACPERSLQMAVVAVTCMHRWVPRGVRRRGVPIGSNPGHATTDTGIRCKSRFETSGEFITNPSSTSRSEATVCAVTGGTGSTEEPSVEQRWIAAGNGESLTFPATSFASALNAG